MTEVNKRDCQVIVCIKEYYGFCENLSYRRSFALVFKILQHFFHKL